MLVLALVLALLPPLGSRCEPLDERLPLLDWATDTVEELLACGEFDFDLAYSEYTCDEEESLARADVDII